jgi:hypothetical protein
MEKPFPMAHLHDIHILKNVIYDVGILPLMEHNYAYQYIRR